ncbi:hypothetical protein AB6A40_005339 [Gnathostoma spinigerum]|uniref:CAAX prenyl protease n=1 Tax=Gnathostoma spinigerum TaxID=75299 RepID=A0ABD6EQU2_9BILA
MFWLILIISWTIFIWDLYLSFRQYQVHKNTEKRPDHVAEIISEEDYSKARLYKVDKHEFDFLYSIYSQLLITVVLCGNIFLWLWNKSGWICERMNYNSELLQSVVFASLISVIETIIDFPWQAYDNFVIEEKHGFNKQTFGFFVKDKVKKTAVSLIIMAPIIAAVIYIISHGGPYFFFYVWIFLSIVILLLMTVYPEFIAPLFDKYTPLPDSSLKTQIEELAAKVNFPLKKLYVVHGSKRSAHSNAYMYGFWKNKRIVLYDTLLSDEMNNLLKEVSKKEDGKDETTEEEDSSVKKTGMSDVEVVAVLGHELGHWALNHSVINLVITEVNLLFMLCVFSHFYQHPALYAAFGFLDSKPIIIGLIIIFQYVNAPYNELFSFVMTVMSRRMEFAADRYSQKLGHGENLCRSLIKLGKDNLSIPIDDPLYSMFNHSHPPIPERIESLRKME